MRSIALAILFATIISGCGLMMKGRTQLVMVDSAPPGQVVQIDAESYTTPAQIPLARY